MHAKPLVVGRYTIETFDVAAQVQASTCPVAI
jgi:hypothetical protein